MLLRLCRGTVPGVPPFPLHWAPRMSKHASKKTTIDPNIFAVQNSFLADKKFVQITKVALKISDRFAEKELHKQYLRLRKSRENYKRNCITTMGKELICNKTFGADGTPLLPQLEPTFLWTSARTWEIEAKPKNHGFSFSHAEERKG